VQQIPDDQLSALQEAIVSTPNRYRGATALMWTHPRGELFRILDQAGVNAVISFSSRERYADPDQVVYSRGGYGQGQNLRLGMTVSWRQWSELLEDVERGEEILVEARAFMESFPNRLETIYAWIPGSEPDLPGVVYTAHLFEGYTKRGANDNVGGPAVQLEILRALHRLIETGKLPQPRRTLHFIWPDEYSGTYEFLRRDPELLERLAININMDMVSEALRKNNGIFAMSETPPHLASFFDGLAQAVMDYVWRTNDIVYPYPVSPRDRSGGQYFPRPLWEKNGSKDAFRFYTHETTGQSDHEVFNGPSVAVPGIHFFVWPDQVYHADKDLPESGDPTTMRRVAFIGAATEWRGWTPTGTLVWPGQSSRRAWIGKWMPSAPSMESARGVPRRRPSWRPAWSSGRVSGKVWKCSSSRRHGREGFPFRGFPGLHLQNERPSMRSLDWLRGYGGRSSPCRISAPCRNIDEIIQVRSMRWA